MFNLFKKRIPAQGRNEAKWRKVSELSPGMKIAAPRAGLLEEHLHRPSAEVAQADIEPSAGDQSRLPKSRVNVGSGMSDIIWDEIVAIKPLGRERVYDIEVEGSHNFVGNNIFAHNTYITGSVGIGTSSPDYKLAVGGDVAATGFVNISSESAKKDVEFLDEGEEKSILEKIRATNVATYNYKTDYSVASTPHLMRGRGPLYSDNNQYKGSLGFASGKQEGGSEQQEADLTGGKRLGLIAEQAPSEVLAASGKGVDLYKLGTFVLAGLKAESKEREGGILALDTRIAEEMSSLRENVATKRLSVLGSQNGDLLYIATGEAPVASTPTPPLRGRGRGPLYPDTATGTAMYKGSLTPSSGFGGSGQQDNDPIFRITSSGEVQVRDDIVFGPKRSVIALNEPQWVVALSEDEAQAQLRPAYKGAVIVVGAADGTHVFNAKTHKEMGGYAYLRHPSRPASSAGLRASSERPSPAQRDEGVEGSHRLSTGSLDSALADSGSARDDGGVLPGHIAADYFTQSFDENTLGQWPFSTLADATGRGNDLSMVGSVSLAAEGVRGTAAAFDGSGYLSVASTPFFVASTRQPAGRGPLYPDSTTESAMYKGSLGFASGKQEGGAGMTIGAWVKFNSLSSGQKIISQDGAFSLSLGEGGKAEATVQGAGRVATRKSLAALDNDWHYLVASYSALKARLDVYVDGALSNGDLEGEIPLTGLGLSSEPVKLGAGFYGAMDDAFIAGADVDVSPSAALASSSVIPAKAGIQTPDVIRTNYLVGRKALNYGLAATSGLQTQPSSAAIDKVNNMLYVGTSDGQIITVDLGADAVVSRQVVTLSGAKGLSEDAHGTATRSFADAQDDAEKMVQDDGVKALAVASGAGRTLAAIVGNQLWLDSESVSVRDSLAVASRHPERSEGSQNSTERRTLTVFEDLLITGGKILPEASSGLPLFAITADGVAEGLAFRDVSFANELVNASFEYWEEVPSPSQGEGGPPASQGEALRAGVRVEKPLGWQGSARSGDAKFGQFAIQVTDGVLSTAINNASDFASSTVTLSAWVKTDKRDDVKLVIASPSSSVVSTPHLMRGRDPLYSGQPSISGSSPASAGSEQQSILASSAYHTGSGQWERLIVTTKIPSPLQGEGRARPAPMTFVRAGIDAGVRVEIQSASKTALVDGVMLQRGSLPTAFVPSAADTILANPQYLNFTASIAASASSTPSEQIIANLPAGTFKNVIRIDQLSIGFSSVIPAEARIQIIAANGTDAIVCVASGPSCRASGSLIVSPNQELSIKYSVQGLDAGSGSVMTTAATINLRYYPMP